MPDRTCAAVAVFLQFIDDELAPKLCPGDVVVLDNLRAHHAEGVRVRAALYERFGRNEKEIERLLGC